jgi:SAM-dependent methyltransferase
MQKNWYETFFNGIALEFWRRAVPPEIARAEVDFLESALAMPKGGRVLDIPCGNGRHSAGLAARGYRVTGVDLATEFIAEAKAQCADAEFVEGDMHAIRYDGEFDGAFCFGNSFGYAAYEESCGFLAAVGRALKPGARFAIDTGLAAESILPTRVAQRWMWLGDILYLSQNRYDAAESRLDIQYTFIRDGKVDVRAASSYIRTLAELRRMLRSAGLDAVEYFSGLDRKPYELGSPRLLLIAERRDPTGT